MNNPLAAKATQWLQTAAGPLLVGASLTAGWVWRECMPLAIGGVLAYRLLFWRIDHDESWSALRTVLYTLTVGALVAAVGVALLVETSLAWWGWWRPSEPDPWSTLLLLGMAVASCCLARKTFSECRSELRAWIWVFTGIFVVLMLHRAGWSAASCVFVAGVGIAMIWLGWQLAAVTGTALLRATSERL